jgi:hypothetical protein
MGKTPSTEHLAGILTAAFMAARLRTAPACTNSTSGLAAHAGAATCAPDHRAALGEAARQHRAPTLRRLTAEIEAFDLEHAKATDERRARTRLAILESECPSAWKTTASPSSTERSMRATAAAIPVNCKVKIGQARAARAKLLPSALQA